MPVLQISTADSNKDCIGKGKEEEPLAPAGTMALGKAAENVHAVKIHA